MNLNTPSRSMSTLSLGPLRLHSSPLPSPFRGINQRRSFWKSTPPSPASGSYSNLAHMETTANNNPQSATAQNAFYSALLRSNHPELVVQRYESGSFATNPACEALYLRALERLNSKPPNSQLQTNESGVNLSPEQLMAVSRAVAGPSAVGSPKSNVGGRGNPLHVLVEQSLGAHIFKWVKFAVWFLFTVYFFYVAVAMFVES